MNKPSFVSTRKKCWTNTKKFAVPVPTFIYYNGCLFYASFGCDRDFREKKIIKIQRKINKMSLKR